MIALLLKPSYADSVTKKDATGFGSPNYTGERAAPCGYFFVRNASVRTQWAAVVGSLRAAGFRVYRSSNPAICRPPRLEAGRGATLHTEAHMPSTSSTPISHTEQIRRLAGIADTIGAMLGAFALLPATGQTDALAVSASLADDLAQALAAIAGEAV